MYIVYPVAGPRVSRIPQVFDDWDRMLRKVALQAARAMAILHQHGICHSGKCYPSNFYTLSEPPWLIMSNQIDFTPANILLRMQNLDGLSESEIIRILGELITAEAVTRSGVPCLSGRILQNRSTVLNG